MKQLIKIAAFLLALQILPAYAAERNTAQVLSPARTVLDIQTNKGQLIRLSRAASAVFVADTQIADVTVRSPRLIYLFAKEPGETTLYAVDGRDQIVVAQRVVVSANIDRIQDLFRKLRPNAPVSVKSIGDRLVLSGTVDHIDIAEEFTRVAAAAVGNAEFVVNRIRVSQPTQVNIRVKIAEVSRDINKKLGFNWELIGQATGSLALGFAVGSDIVRNAGTFIFPADPQDRIVSSFCNNSLSADTVIELLDDEGLITVLAEPNLTAMSGETASFLAGGEFPIPVAQDGGVTSIESRQFGVGLSFSTSLRFTSSTRVISASASRMQLLHFVFFFRGLMYSR